MELVAENIVGRHIVELGCGSGLLAMPLLEAGAATYRGMDISNVAIEAALARSAGYDEQERISFENGRRFIFKIDRFGQYRIVIDIVPEENGFRTILRSYGLQTNTLAKPPFLNQCWYFKWQATTTNVV